MDLIIAGNITKDITFDIYNNFKKDIILGGIVNFWCQFQYINKNSYTVDLIPLSYGESIILIDKKLCNRYNRSELNIINNLKQNIKKTKWLHMMYINELDEFNENFLKNINSKILSCDICGGTKNKYFDIKLIKYFDFIFLSEDDLDSNISIDNLKENIKGFLIIHENRSYKIIGNINNNINIDLNLDEEKILENINVLGAGDYFSASFVYFLLDKDIEDVENIKKAIVFSQDSIISKLKNN